MSFYVITQHIYKSLLRWTVKIDMVIYDQRQGLHNNAMLQFIRQPVPLQSC